MMKIVTDTPSSMIGHMRNFVYVKNNEVYVRLAEGDLSLVEYIRKADKELYGIDHDDSWCNAKDFGECMDEDRFTCDMYWALVGFADVREHLKKYESEEEQ